MLKRIIALSIIFICSWIAWGVLSIVMDVRTNEKSAVMDGAVGQLWGDEHTQFAPVVNIAWKTVKRREMTEKERLSYISEKQKQANLEAAGLGIKPEKIKIHPHELFVVEEEDHKAAPELASSDINVDLSLDYRKKGLLWFSTYSVGFDAVYTFTNPVNQPVMTSVSLPFPSVGAVYDNMSLLADGRKDMELQTLDGQMFATFVLPADAKQTLRFSYQSRGKDRWNYRFGNNVKMIKNLRLVMQTDFLEYDFPKGSISPDNKTRRSDGAGYELVWDKKSLVSGLEIGMLMPHRINPGPLASSMSLHAPVSLFFFFFVLFILQVLKGIKIHPMNYFFIAASFFAFNLLFSYLVDQLDVFMAFGIASVVSIFLVVSYLKLVVGTRFALVEACLCQLIYQILFSLAHFFDGYTGLTVTIGAVVTLAVVMRLTAKVDWEKVFKNGRTKRQTMSPTPTNSNHTT
jgi:Inner membrane protein CreD